MRFEARRRGWLNSAMCGRELATSQVVLGAPSTRGTGPFLGRAMASRELAAESKTGACRPQQQRAIDGRRRHSPLGSRCDCSTSASALARRTNSTHETTDRAAHMQKSACDVTGGTHFFVKNVLHNFCGCVQIRRRNMDVSTLTRTMQIAKSSNERCRTIR